ncbi:MAG: hypothetical protein K6A44_00575 [bacterium]|nr:hypothetical protein [bacterium]
MKALNSKYNLIKLNLARNSLRYIVRVYGIKEMYIPYYVCPVIRRALIQEKCKPLFYHIDDSFMPLQDFSKNAFILYPNYFGVCDKNVDILAQKYPHLVVDNAHSFYSEPMGFASFNSARKFLNVYNGSYLWIRDTSLKIAPEQEVNNAPKNEEEMYKNERDFDKAEIELLNEKTADEIARYDTLILRRVKFLELYEKYGNKNLLNIDINSASPFCYPCLLGDEFQADELAQELQKKGLRIYRYWEELPKDYGEYKFFRNLVPIPLGKNM